MFTALLPMKLNSERVPNKNFKLIGGKPLYQWMLDKLLKIELVDKVVINTDADPANFESYLKSEKFLIHKRPESLCGDFVSMNDIIKYDLDNCESKNYIMTHTTNPLISINTVNLALQTFVNRNQQNYDSLYSVTKFQARFNLSENIAINHIPGKLLRTQDLPPVYMENSCFFIFNQDSFNQNDSRVGKKPILFETPHLESIDIDNEEDWYLAELLINDMKKKSIN
jgi:CMP-N-acetylneuraminic acid synthetase